MNGVEVVIDWKAVSSTDDFYSSLFSQVDAPEWHGRNLNALDDSLVVGNINGVNPPYKFRNVNIAETSDDLVSFQRTVIEIFTDSARAYAGSEITIK